MQTETSMKLSVCCFDLKNYCCQHRTQLNWTKASLPIFIYKIKCSTHQNMNEFLKNYLFFFFLSNESLGFEQQKVLKTIYIVKWKRLLNAIGLNARMNDSCFHWYSCGSHNQHAATKCHQNSENEFHYKWLLLYFGCWHIFIIITSLSLSIKFHIHILWWKSYSKHCKYQIMKSFPIFHNSLSSFAETKMETWFVLSTFHLFYSVFRFSVL